MSEEAGADGAQRLAAALYRAIYDKYQPTTRAELHDAILAERAIKEREKKMLTAWADAVRAGEVDRCGSQRKAADELGVGRRTVRPRGKAKQ